MDKSKIIILAGPTAVGKTELSIRLAKQINAEIISADSMQVYRGMDIGSAKISICERQEVRHYLIDCMDPNEEFNVAVFQKMAQEAIQMIQDHHKIPMIVGGTAFYIQAFLKGVDFTQEQNAYTDEYRESLQAIAKQEHGTDQLFLLLQKEDPEYAKQVHENNVKRVIRALEYKHHTGMKFSDYNEVQKNKEDIYASIYFVLTQERTKLYEAINKRVDTMMEMGLLDEVKKLRASGLKATDVSMQGLGYKELLSYLEGEGLLEDAVNLIKQDTRHFAKRQLTWFRREEHAIWLSKDEYGNDTERILQKMTEEIEAADNRENRSSRR